MNWILFILIFASLLCRPNVRKETSSSGNLRKLKENFMIALGLSLLFGMGWAIGLLATSDLPAGVRYPAEWVFTLTTAFLGVYLFILYVVRSQEARKLWKRWLLCQCKKKRGVSFSSSHPQSRSRLKTLSSVLASWKGNRRDTLKNSRSTVSTSGSASTIFVKHGLKAIEGHVQPVNLELVEKMKPDKWCYSDAFVREPSWVAPEGAKEETVEADETKNTFQNPNANDSVLPAAEELVNEFDGGDWCYNPLHQSHSVNKLSLKADDVPSKVDPSFTGTHRDIVENKQSDGTQVTPL